MDRLGSEPILSVKQSVSIDTMLNFDGDRDGDGTCKQTLTDGRSFNYRPQMKFAKVMFSQVSVCQQGGGCPIAY